MSDRTGGSQSDKAEEDALHRVISYFVEDYCQSEFAQNVMTESLAQKSEWLHWTDQAQNILSDCAYVIENLKIHIGEKHIEAFKHNLLEIAMSVAMAYREQNEKEQTSIGHSVKEMFECIQISLGLKAKPQIDQIMNISKSEKKAINDLASCFGIEWRVG
jgi:hypothetical protein